MKSEYSINQLLDHPNIAALVQPGWNDALYYYMAFEYADNCSLHEFVQVRKITKAFIEEEVNGFLQQLGSALRYLADKKIVHGDLKPHNVLLHGPSKMKICDFGLATFAP